MLHLTVQARFVQEMSAQDMSVHCLNQPSEVTTECSTNRSPYLLQSEVELERGGAPAAMHVKGGDCEGLHRRLALDHAEGLVAVSSLDQLDKALDRKALHLVGLDPAKQAPVPLLLRGPIEGGDVREIEAQHLHRDTGQ